MVSKIIGLLTGLKAKVYLWGVAVVVALGFLLKIYTKGRSDGSQSLRDAINKRNEKIQDEWKQIDRTPVDFDSAIDRLRKRSTEAGNKPEA